MFSKTELDVMSKLLDLASGEFSNHGCNDFEIPATDENISLATQVEDESDPVVQVEKFSYQTGL
jgi:hypothetical protein